MCPGSEEKRECFEKEPAAVGNKLCALVIVEHFREITAEFTWSDKDDRKGMMQ